MNGSVTGSIQRN